MFFSPQKCWCQMLKYPTFVENTQPSLGGVWDDFLNVGRSNLTNQMQMMAMMMGSNPQWEHDGHVYSMHVNLKLKGTLPWSYICVYGYIYIYIYRNGCVFFHPLYAGWLSNPTIFEMG